MNQGGYRPRVLIILGIMIVFGQFVSMNLIKQDLDKKIAECYDAINTNSVVQGALVNLLVQKGLIEREQLLKETQSLSVNLQKMMEEMQQQQQQNSPAVQKHAETVP